MQQARDVLVWGQRLSADFERSRASLAAGGLAYFVALSIAPAALVLGALAGLVVDPQQVHDALERIAGRAPASADALQPLIESIVGTIESATAASFTVTTVIGVVVAVYGASKVVLGLRMAMNTIFGVVETRSSLVERGISAVVTLVGLVVGATVVVLATFVPSVLAWLGIDGPALLTGHWVLRWVVFAVLVHLAVRWLLRHAPNDGRPVPWRSRGAWVATAGILAATVGVGAYAQWSASLNAAVIVFGTAVVLLLLLYLSFLALLWGAVIEADDQRRRAEADRSASETANAGDRQPGR